MGNSKPEGELALVALKRNCVSQGVAGPAPMFMGDFTGRLETVPFKTYLCSSREAKRGFSYFEFQAVAMATVSAF